MKEYIIYAPQLQSLKKRIGSLLVWAVCWVMWVYLLVPLITLSNWVMGDRKVINEMRWFGGYKSLLELMQIYVSVLLVMIAFWLCWSVYRAFRSRAARRIKHRVVDDAQLCEFYQVQNDELQQCRNASLITVYFDDHGHIVHLEPQEKQ